MWIVNAAALIGLCGCVQPVEPPSPPVAPPVAAAPLRHAAVRHRPRNDLTAAQKDKLFQNFQAWQATRREREREATQQATAAHDAEPVTAHPVADTPDPTEAASSSLNVAVPAVSRD